MFLGIVALCLGVIGVFVPILPTTPFLLLASFCFARSNQKFNNWLLNNKFFGAYIQDYLSKRVVKKSVKWGSITVLWITIALSISVINTGIWLKLVLVGIAIGVTLHLLSLKENNRTNS